MKNTALDDKSGQALVESCVMVILLCLILLGLFQVSQIFMAEEILNYAAARGARARAVGFNPFMVYKTSRVGSIAAAGLMTQPGRQSSQWAQLLVEESRIPLYLGAQQWAQLPPILDYRDWNTIAYPPTTWEESLSSMVNVRLDQEYPLNIAFHRAFYGADEVDLRGDARFDNHYPLYLQ